MLMRYAILAGLLIGSPSLLWAQSPSTHFLKVAIDEKATAREMLPIAPVIAPHLAPLTEDLSQVPEVNFQKAIAPGKGKGFDSHQVSPAAIEIARQMAKINFLNAKKRDLFMDTLIEARPDLAGLPFLLGDAARLPKADLVDFKEEGDWVRACMNIRGKASFWKNYDATLPDRVKNQAPKDNGKFIVAALMQILSPERPYHDQLVKRLTDLGKPAEREVTEALARLAVFSLDANIRQAATQALQLRPAELATPILVKGLHYPWPRVAQNSAEALVALNRVDQAPELIRMLDEPDPRAPVTRKGGTDSAPEVRELVRIHHARNCLLCHAPGNTPDVLKPKIAEWKDLSADVQGTTTHYPNQAEEIVFGGIPIPGLEIPTTSYGRFLNDRVVRVDVTYLRPDFSLFEKTLGVAPWPDMQRFDYIVRTRKLSPEETPVYQKAFAETGPDTVYRRTALDALRQLTGKDAGTTSEAWRKALGL